MVLMPKNFNTTNHYLLKILKTTGKITMKNLLVWLISQEIRDSIDNIDIKNDILQSHVWKVQTLMKEILCMLLKDY